MPDHPALGAIHLSAVDLLEARAAVDWAVAQLPTIAARIEAWKKTAPYGIVTEFDPERGKDALKFDIRHPLPLVINAEAGAIIHMMRSGLDLLAVALAKRNGHALPKDVYFPINVSPEAFLDPKGGMEKIKRLSAKDIEAIKNLQPYRGGNGPLYALHYFDVERKHRQLLRITEATRQWGLWGTGLNAEFPVQPVFNVEHGAVLAWITVGAPKPNIEFPCEISLGEPRIFPKGPLIPALREFGSLVSSIIKLFDAP
jgi:hypothetical protein